MAAVILAAGSGTRLRPLTDTIPKALVLCAGWPLIAYATEFARRAVGAGGRIVIVTGYRAAQVAAWADAEAPDAVLAHNARFERGNLLSVAAALPHLPDDFLLMSVDQVHPWAMAERLFAAPGGVVAATDRDRALGTDDMKVALGPEGGVARISKGLAAWDRGYIGMTRVRASGAVAWREAVASVAARRGDDAGAEEVLAELADLGRPAAVADLSGLGWIEVNTLDDLEAAEERLMTDPELLSRGWGA